MVRIPEPRGLRRLAKRRKAHALAMTPELPKDLRQGRPRYGVRFGVADPRAGEDRRQAERRTEDLSGQALDDRLAELGITADRRTGDRRHGDRRRR